MGHKLTFYHIFKLGSEAEGHKLIIGHLIGATISINTYLRHFPMLTVYIFAGYCRVLIAVKLICHGRPGSICTTTKCALRKLERPENWYTCCVYNDVPYWRVKHVSEKTTITPQTIPALRPPASRCALAIAYTVCCHVRTPLRDVSLDSFFFLIRSSRSIDSSASL
jgi:hypothetical protein